MPITVFIADDHPLVVRALTSGIDEPDIKVVGHTEHAADVAAKYSELLPDVLVLDLNFGPEAESTGLDIAKAILAKHKRARIVIYSQFETDEMIREAYMLGASAFLPKRAPLDDVITAIRQVHQEGTYLLPSLAERVAKQLLAGMRDQSPQDLLDEREMEVFRHLALGRETAEIAEIMDLAPKTITRARQGIKQKLNEDNPVRLALIAVKHGVITKEELAQHGVIRHHEA
jgi:two-component system invasion response regulator UvrY